MDWKRRYWEAFLRNEKIKVLTTDKILDAGCGPAGIFMVFPKNKVLAIDPLLDFYSQRIPHFKKNNYPTTDFKKINLEHLKLSGVFDKIFCLNVINHVQDLEKCIHNLRTALKKNRELYLSIDAHNFGLLKNVFRFIPGDILHPHQLDLKEYEYLLKKNGFEIRSKSLVKKGFIFNYYLLKAVKR